MPPTLTLTPSATLTFTLTAPPTVTLTPTPAGTQPLYTLTPPSSAGAPAAADRAMRRSARRRGWTCDDFPCEDDIDGFLKRIQVPPGFQVEYIGQFPGEPVQITYGQDGRLYATVLENGTRTARSTLWMRTARPTRYSGDFVSPLGLAFQPGTDVLYVSARVTLEQGGGHLARPAGRRRA